MDKFNFTHTIYCGIQGILDFSVFKINTFLYNSLIFSKNLYVDQLAENICKFDSFIRVFRLFFMAQKKTVLVLASTYPRWKEDHEPRFIHELCKRLSSKFHVIALVPDAKDADPSGIFENVEVIRYRYAPKSLQSLVNNGGIVANLKTYWWKWLLVPSFLLSQFFAVKALLRKRKIDAIHAHWLLPQGWIAYQLTKKTNIPFIVTSHGGDLYGLQGYILTQEKKKVAESSIAMTVVSSAMKAYLEEQNIYPKRLQIIPMGIDLRTRFVPNPSIERKQYELLFVGRLVPKKGVNFLLEALAILIKKFPQLRLRIVGFGPEETSIKVQIQDLNLDHVVDFIGSMPQERLPELYQSATAFVAPFIRANNGDQEGLPVAFMEAIGCSCPAVVGQVAGIEDLLGSDFKDVAVNPKNIQELVSAISQILEQPELALKRAERIRQNAIDFIDWENVAERYALLLDQSILQFKNQMLK